MGVIEGGWFEEGKKKVEKNFTSSIPVGLLLVVVVVVVVIIIIIVVVVVVVVVVACCLLFVSCVV